MRAELRPSTGRCTAGTARGARPDVSPSRPRSGARPCVWLCMASRLRDGSVLDPVLAMLSFCFCSEMPRLRAVGAQRAFRWSLGNRPCRRTSGAEAEWGDAPGKEREEQNGGGGDAVCTNGAEGTRGRRRWRALSLSLKGAPRGRSCRREHHKGTKWLPSPEGTWRTSGSSTNHPPHAHHLAEHPHHFSEPLSEMALWRALATRHAPDIHWQHGLPIQGDHIKVCHIEHAVIPRFAQLIGAQRCAESGRMLATAMGPQGHTCMCHEARRTREGALLRRLSIPARTSFPSLGCSMEWSSKGGKRRLLQRPRIGKPALEPRRNNGARAYRPGPATNVRRCHACKRVVNSDATPQSSATAAVEGTHRGKASELPLCVVWGRHGRLWARRAHSHASPEEKATISHPPPPGPFRGSRKTI